MSHEHPLAPKIRLVIIVVLIAVLFFLVVSFAIPVERVVMTINVPVDASAASVQSIVSTLDEHDATATFFLTGDWALEHENLTRSIAERHEIGCFTMTGARLAFVANENLSGEIKDCDETLENITGKDVEGFRAPDNEVRLEVYDLASQYFSYDSSTYQRYTWFWEVPKSGIIEVPISSVLIIPLHDRVGLQSLPLGDFWFYMSRKAAQETVIMAFNTDIVAEHELDFDYLIAYYAHQDIPIMSMGGWMGE